LREQLDEINDGIKHLQVALLNLAEQEASTILPGLQIHRLVG
jgi:argininosuccinate lyase